MRRVVTQPRPDWQRIVEEQGLHYAVLPDESGRPTTYWDESAYYEFSLAEVERLEEVVAELHELCLDAVEHVVATRRYADYGITDSRVIQLIEQSWRDRDREISLYGRFDLRYDGSGPARLLEYNADTPTSLLEAAGPQWFWLEDRFPDADQWNSLHERLVDAWRKHPISGPLHLAFTTADEIGEDYVTVSYLQECAELAGHHTVCLPMEEIGWDPGRLGRSSRFVDEQDREIKTIFKLYPWEWMVGDQFGGHLLDLALSGRGPRWIEPAWKMLLSNKALLAVLWERHPGHPNLLPAYLDGPRDLIIHGYVAKPLLGREGAGVQIITPGFTIGEAAEGPQCYQAFYALPEFDGVRPVLGAWVVDGEPAGLGIRETSGLITDTGARFVPHVIH
ncbi:glutathionylspermidine synthase family protein [Hamadaea sp. NPDC051192]|uniref:glutathionylspermidine synthase family protein n=1 Tax=Hamadaea sp. NPDC051192 TaxID=3154940 RepID=UPI00342FA246